MKQAAYPTRAARQPQHNRATHLTKQSKTSTKKHQKLGGVYIKRNTYTTQ